MLTASQKLALRLWMDPRHSFRWRNSRINSGNPAWILNPENQKNSCPSVMQDKKNHKSLCPCIYSTEASSSLRHSSIHCLACSSTHSLALLPPSQSLLPPPLLPSLPLFLFLNVLESMHPDMSIHSTTCLHTVLLSHAFTHWLARISTRNEKFSLPRETERTQAPIWYIG